MNREILFRGKRLNNGEWVKGFYVGASDNAPYHEIFIPNDKPSIPWERHLVDPDTVEQFTGLADKNGVRIFEGDIVQNKMKWGTNTGVIVFWNGCFVVDWKIKCEWSGNGISCRTDDLCAGDEIIGNIHDNPELLEVQK